MRDDTEKSTVEENRLMILIEQMQRQGRSEREITEAVRQASDERY